MPRGRTIVITSIAGVVVLAAAGGGAYYVLHTRGTPQETAQRFTSAWTRGDLTAMKTELAAPASGFDAAYAELTKNLGATKVTVSDLSVSAPADGHATAKYTVTASLKNMGDWTYQTQVGLTVKDHYWKVDWSPQSVHPALDGTDHLAVKTSWPDRATIMNAQGDRIDVGEPGGSVQQLVGYLDKATAKDVKKLGTAYRVGNAIGRGGLQETFQKQLAGTPTTTIEVTGSHTETLHTIKGKPGRSVTTSLDPRIQAAAADAVRNVKKPTSLVAIRPSTGEILAVANNVGGFNRAIGGIYPPGSTFKTITAAGLLAGGLTPSSKVTCPATSKIGGLDIRNSDHEAFGSLTFSDSYAHSCNTTFAPLAASKLGAQKLYDTATLFGFNQKLNIGVPTTKASMPKATSDAELASEAFGQARITSSPLVMAAVAAAVADGNWRPPTLVPALKQKLSVNPLPDGVAAPLRSMMSAVVTKGTAHGSGLPAGTAGKTGTAEFGPAGDIKTHAWFIGFRGNVAFAVLVEAGGMGGSVAAPIAAKFLKSIG
ncbi:penicillin-binding protein [Planotetraspora thailandica]|uniref:Penicillin-binding protein n=1 Tax=Planotetraspora thailandica TaxID=487172 RepID=A0A8J3Y008_9ACTN|nr:penicillin-binding transpeptidase domain-containing protein [Planotetraspora thailandica]GII58310.1 penicillin-binding protein [Planotetraspora thailandica]